MTPFRAGISLGPPIYRENWDKLVSGNDCLLAGISERTGLIKGQLWKRVQGCSPFSIESNLQEFLREVRKGDSAITVEPDLSGAAPYFADEETGTTEQYGDDSASPPTTDTQGYQD